MINNIKKDQLILASKSPRRLEILSNAGLEFIVKPSAFDETTLKKEDPAVFVQKLAFHKAEYVSFNHSAKWIIGADTIVVTDSDTILEKPVDKKDAFNMIQTLSNSKHHVYTGFCLLNVDKGIKHIDYARTDVFFKFLTEEEINWYINTDEPYDKAGGYAIQGKGSFMITKINGSYSNVVGLPLSNILDALKKFSLINYK